MVDTNGCAVLKVLSSSENQEKAPGMLGKMERHSHLHLTLRAPQATPLAIEMAW